MLNIIIFGKVDFFKKIYAIYINFLSTKGSLSLTWNKYKILSSQLIKIVIYTIYFWKKIILLECVCV